MRLRKICSGGQTGADQEGLRQAKRRGLATGGWCPKGWKTEKGSEPWLAEFGLVEHPSFDYKPRTWANVRDSDVTVWFGNTDSPGYICTKNGCKHHNKPFYENPTAEQMLVLAMAFECINVAGNRISKNPWVAGQVKLAFGLILSHHDHTYDENGELDCCAGKVKDL